MDGTNRMLVEVEEMDGWQERKSGGRVRLDEWMMGRIEVGVGAFKVRSE